MIHNFHADQRCKELKPTPDATVPYNYVCSEKCGNVSIAYPFGIEEKCYMNERFRVSCKDTGSGSKPFISSIKLQLLSVSFLQGSVIVNNSIATNSNSCSKDEDNNRVSVNLAGSLFFFSHLTNRFFSTGCGSFVTILRNPTDYYPLGGCLQPRCYSDNKVINSNASCFTIIPPGLSSYAANMTEIYPSDSGNRSCGSAFLADASNLIEDSSIWVRKYNSESSWTMDPSTYQGPKFGHVPTALQWGMPKRGLCELRNGSNTLCSSDSQYCWSSISSTYLCVCSVDNVYVNEQSFARDIYSTNVCQGTYHTSIHAFVHIV